MNTTFSLKFINSSQNQMILILEPWAEEYIIDAGKTVEIVANNKCDSSIELEYTDDGCIIVYGWSDSITIYCDGQKLKPK